MPWFISWGWDHTNPSLVLLIEEEQFTGIVSVPHHVLYHETMCLQPTSYIGNSPFAVSNLAAGKHFIKIRPDGPRCIPWPNRQPMRVDFSIE